MRLQFSTAILALLMMGCTDSGSTGSHAVDPETEKGIQDLHKTLVSAGCSVERIAGAVRLTCAESYGDIKDGKDGEDGAQGERGDKGERGDQGVQGLQGLQGQQGVAGAQGIQGVAGPQGLQGSVGPEGPQGPAGRARRFYFGSPARKMELVSMGTVPLALWGGSSEAMREVLAWDNLNKLFMYYSSRYLTKTDTIAAYAFEGHPNDGGVHLLTFGKIYFTSTNCTLDGAHSAFVTGNGSNVVRNTVVLFNAKDRPAGDIISAVNTDFQTWKVTDTWGTSPIHANSYMVGSSTGPVCTSGQASPTLARGSHRIEPVTLEHTPVRWSVAPHLLTEVDP